MINFYIDILFGVIGCGCIFSRAKFFVFNLPSYFGYLFNSLGRVLAWSFLFQITGGMFGAVYLHFEIFLSSVYAIWHISTAEFYKPGVFHWSHRSQIIFGFYLKKSKPRKAANFNIFYWVLLHAYIIKTGMIYHLSHCFSYTFDWCFKLCWYKIPVPLGDWYCHYLCDYCKWNWWVNPYFGNEILRLLYRNLFYHLLENYFQYEFITWQTKNSVWSCFCRLFFGAESSFNHQCKFLDYIFGFYFSLLVVLFCRKFMLNDYFECFRFLGAAAVQPSLLFVFQCIISFKVHWPLGFDFLFACSSFERRGLEDLFKDLVTFLFNQRVGPLRGF